MVVNANDPSPAFPLGDRFRVAGWSVDARALRIGDGHTTVKLEPKVMELLVCLASRPGEVMTRQELEEQVWRGVVVSDDALTSAVIKLRKAFGDDSRNPQIIETIPKVGYSLIAEVETATPAGAAAEEQVPAGRGPEPDTAITETTLLLSPSGRRMPSRRALALVGVAAMVLLVVASVLMLWISAQKEAVPTDEVSSIVDAGLPLPDRPSIAVLPFELLGGRPGQQYFSDGFTNDLITELSKFRDLFVIASHSSFSYKGKPVKSQEISRELGVRYVLEGTVQRQGERLRINAQLVEATTGRHVWAERYEREASDLLEVQDEIIATVVATLSGRLTEAEVQRVLRKTPASLEAYDFYLRGRDLFLQFGPENTAEAGRMFEKAIALDPGYARAYAELALVLTRNWILYGAPDTDRDRALELVKKALALDHSDHRIHWVAGTVYLYRWQHEQAAAAFERAYELNPNDADFLAGSTDILIYIGRPEDAIAQLKRAMRLNPLYPDWYYFNLAWGYDEAGRHEEALEALTSVRVDTPEWVHRDLAAAYVRLGRLEEARAEAKKYLESHPTFSLAAEAKREKAKLPYKDPKSIDDYIEALRKAGFPE